MGLKDDSSWCLSTSGASEGEGEEGTWSLGRTLVFPALLMTESLRGAVSLFTIFLQKRKARPHSSSLPRLFTP